MARPAYSADLWDGYIDSVAGTTYESPAVPLHYLWVIRDITIAYSKTAAQGLADWRITDGSGAPIWCRLYVPAFRGDSWHWEGRHVLSAFNIIKLETDTSGLTWKVSGYVLSA